MNEQRHSSASKYRSCHAPPSKATEFHHTHSCPRPTDQLTKLFTSRLVVAQQCFKSEVLFPTGMLTNVCVSICVCIWDFPGGSVVKNQPAMQETRGRSLAWEDRGEGHGSPWYYSYNNGQYHGQRSQVGYGPWGHIKWDKTQ